MTLAVGTASAPCCDLRPVSASNLSPELESIGHPRWYNAVTSNCTTNIRAQRSVNQRAPWDWRILVNGKADELLYERHAIATGGLPFSELKQRSLINERARAADQDPAFSRLIRADLPQSD